MPLGASASVAYYGWVDTKLVQDGFDRKHSGRLQEIAPTACSSGSTPTRPGRRPVRGIEERAPRTFVPKWWRYVSALRGIINPLLDRRIERDAQTAALIRDLDAKGVDAGS